MRFEFIIFLVAGFLIANIYTNNHYWDYLKTFKKYYQMIGIGFGALMICWLIRRDPARAREILVASNDYVKYLPIDRNTKDILSPILDFTTKRGFEDKYSSRPTIHLPPVPPVLETTVAAVGERFKRSVGETKKKFVAARQNWCCGDCRRMLPAWFEVDHVIRLDAGGSNHIDNLVALCRDCHGKKTAIENL
jgi:hypothetical protein